MATISQAESPPIPLPAVVPPVPILRLTVEQYHAMGEAGILGPEDRVELLEGWLVPKMNKKPPHAVTSELIYAVLARLLPAGWHARAQNPITLTISEPEPDIVVVRGGSRDYLKRHPVPSEVAIVIEVADSSLAQDRGLKKRIYAEARIRVYWIVNLVDRIIEVYTDPSGPGEEPDYRQRRDFSSADEIPVMLEGREAGRVPVRDILP